MALGLDCPRRASAAAAAVLFAVNVTAVLPATPANVGVFQAACVAVLVGAYHVSTPDAIAYGIVLQAVEVATALLMGVPALLNEGLSWRDVRLRTMHATPVTLAGIARARRSRPGRHCDHQLLSQPGQATGPIARYNAGAVTGATTVSRNTRGYGSPPNAARAGATRGLGSQRRLVLGLDGALGRIVVADLAEQRRVARGALDHVVGRAVGSRRPWRVPK